jgi:hypothetical protein
MLHDEKIKLIRHQADPTDCRIFTSKTCNKAATFEKILKILSDPSSFKSLGIRSSSCPKDE